MFSDLLVFEDQLWRENGEIVCARVVGDMLTMLDVQKKNEMLISFRDLCDKCFKSVVPEAFLLIFFLHINWIYLSLL